jgi:hypothetical protein
VIVRGIAGSLGHQTKGLLIIQMNDGWVFAANYTQTVKMPLTREGFAHGHCKWQ